MFGDGFMEFMGYRNMVTEDKIEECMAQIRSGKTEVDIDAGDLTQAEIEYVESEVRKRIKGKK